MARYDRNPSLYIRICDHKFPTLSYIMNAFYNIRVPNGEPIAHIGKSSTSLIDLIKICEDAANKNLYISAKQISDALFPVSANTIFISHFSHEKEVAHIIKDTIEEQTKCRCFIDSDVWENVYESLTILKNQFAKQWFVVNKVTKLEEKVYDSADCTNLSKHLFLILALALQRAVMHSSAFVFISSSPCQSIINIDNELHVKSPWVALELFASQYINSVPLQKVASLNEMTLPQIAYPASVSHLCMGNVSSFIQSFKNLYGM